MTKIDIKKFCEAIPESEQDIKRFKFLTEDANDIRIAVFGKYNHGKSTLLNAIIGEEVFKTSDKRQTIKNQTHQHGNIIWVDTPGLDADVTESDDREAKDGAFTTADALFLVHNINSGELDKYEIKYYQDLIKQKNNYKKKLFLILTQIDQVSTEQLNVIVSVIEKQLPELTMLTVSATRYNKGVRENKPALVANSGMKEIFQLLGKFTHEIRELRTYEKNDLTQKLKHALTLKRCFVAELLQRDEDKLAVIKHQFSTDVITYLNNVQAKI